MTEMVFEAREDFTVENHTISQRQKHYVLSMTFNRVIHVPDDFDPAKHAVPNDQHISFLRSIIAKCETAIIVHEEMGEQCQKSE